ncbi:MAG: type VI secretion system tube protein Hcp [Rubrivivax sp.]|nr:type VI secretion system tube protein Hcp [Rubrivivax sp.]
MESTTQIFLRIAIEHEDDIIVGEGMIDKYNDPRIQVQSFDFSMQAKQNTVRTSGDYASSNLDMGKVKVTKPFDTASNRIALLVKNRTKFSEARLTVDQHMTWGQQSEREQNAIIVFHLLNGHVVSQSLSAKEEKSGAAISETLELSFKNVQVDYYIQQGKEAASASGRTYRATPVASFVTEFDDSDD